MSEQTPQEMIEGNPTNQRNSEEMEQTLDFLVRPITQTMRREVFETDFLPFFDLRGIEKEIVDQMIADMERSTGLKQTERALVGNLMRRWVEKVRSPYLETEIINDDGSVMFKVPPLLRSHEDVLTIGGEKLTQLVETANNHYNVHPNEGNNFFRRQILPHVIKHEMTVEEAKQWNIIFDHYGFPRYTIPGEEAPTTTGQAVAASKPADEDSECDYELD